MTLCVLEADSQSPEVSIPESGRILLIGQLGLLLLRAERGVRIDVRSVLRLALVVRRIEGHADTTITQSARAERGA